MVGFLIPKGLLKPAEGLACPGQTDLALNHLFEPNRPYQDSEGGFLLKKKKKTKKKKPAPVNTINIKTTHNKLGATQLHSTVPREGQPGYNTPHKG